MPVKQFQVTFL